MTPEEKAREAAEDAYPSDDANTPEYVREHARACYALGYLAGHAEAMRWRDPVQEPPTQDGRYLVITCGSYDLSIYYWTKEVGWYRELGWRVLPTSWSPIPPLPTHDL